MMGCVVSSKIETEEAVKRCKARKQYMKQAVLHRHELAAAHASYVTSLKSTGAAIRQFADVETSPQEAPVPLPPMPQAPSVKPPPPLPLVQSDPFLVPRTPLPRAQSLPPFALKSMASPPKAMASHPQPVSEDEDEFDQGQGYAQHKATNSEPLFFPETSTSDVEEFEVKTVARGDQDDAVEQQASVLEVKKVAEEKSGFERERRKQPQTPRQQKIGRTNKDLTTLLRILDDHFLESYEAGREVSQLLDAQRDYNHIPYVDVKYGIKEHNKKVFRVLTWTKFSPESFMACDDTEVFPNGNVNLASTLDRLHAWEKKLLDEVKAAEATRLELNRRSNQLRHQKDRREAAATIGKTKTLVKTLQTKYVVEFQAVDAAFLEIQKLRDDVLFPQLMGLLKALGKMWRKMFDCHEKQIPVVEELKCLEATPSMKETSDFCKQITEDLEREVKSWHAGLETVITFQKSCVQALLDWLNLNAKQIESEAFEKPAPLQDVGIRLHDLCEAWVTALEGLSAEEALKCLEHFSLILRQMATKQVDEIKQKKRKEDVRKDWERKKKALEAFESKYKEKSGSSQESRHPLQERKALVELLAKNLDEETERHAKLCEENSTMILKSLQDGLPDVLKSILDFSRGCADIYGKLLIVKQE